MKKPKSYEEYKNQWQNRHDSIMSKYGAPSVKNGDSFTAKPPKDSDPIPSASDREYRQYALTLKTRLESWPKSGRKYP